jgi:hypothetical protein
MVYSYPLRRAQEEGYFTKITFKPAHAFSQSAADKAIAEMAVKQLGTDIRNGFDHLVMARTETIARAQKVLEIYEDVAPHFQPVVVHSEMSAVERKAVLNRVLTRDAKVVVCVDMLGEGFDLPHLKIAALHDVHKSLAVTLQFTGRFTRSSSKVGEATMIARSDAEVDDALRQLYGQDPDWNHIIQRLSEGAVDSEIQKSEFQESFQELPDEVPLQNLFPKMSTIVFKTSCADWDPNAAVRATFRSQELYAGPSWSPEQSVVWFVTREVEAVSWGLVKELENTSWHLYVIRWDKSKNLLYINSSNNAHYHFRLARRLVGTDVQLIKGEEVYRCLSGITRLSFITVGLLHAYGRAIRHTMLNGGAIEDVLTPAQTGTKSKTNVFGRGYESGSKVTIGCSRRGRIWSMKVAGDLSEWVNWVDIVGTKLLDESIDTTEVMKGVIIPKFVTARPREYVPISVDWPEELYQRNEEWIYVIIDGHDVPFFQVELQVDSPSKDGPIGFSLLADGRKVAYRLKFTSGGVTFQSVEDVEAKIKIGNRQWKLSEFFESFSPVVYFDKDSFLEDSHLFTVNRAHHLFDHSRISSWDWTGTELTKESQGPNRDTDSIQYRVIREVLKEPWWEIVFDDDDSGEAADVVAIGERSGRIEIGFYHCKYAPASGPRSQVSDLYEVCGQAQKSIRWRQFMDRLFEHLLHREQLRIDKGLPTRFERGDAGLVQSLKSRTHQMSVDMKMTIVQPALMQSNLSEAQLELLGATALLLSETYQIPLWVITSK